MSSFSQSCFSDPSIGLFYQFVPQFFGISRKVQEDGSKVKIVDILKPDPHKKITKKNQQAEFLMMENLTLGFKLPCIMDVKIGAR